MEFQGSGRGARTMRRRGHRSRCRLRLGRNQPSHSSTMPPSTALVILLVLSASSSSLLGVKGDGEESSTPPPPPSPPPFPLDRQLTASDFMSLRFSHIDNLLGDVLPSYSIGGKKTSRKKGEGTIVTEDARRPDGGGGKSKKGSSKEEEERAEAKWADWVKHGWEVATVPAAEGGSNDQFTAPQKADDSAPLGRKWTAATLPPSSNATAKDRESRLVTPDLESDVNRSGDSLAPSPFLFCVYSSTLASGARRLPYLLDSIRYHSGAVASPSYKARAAEDEYKDDDNVVVVANTALQSCYIIAAPADVAQRVASSSSPKDDDYYASKITSADSMEGGAKGEGKSKGHNDDFEKESRKGKGPKDRKGAMARGAGEAASRAEGTDVDIRVLPIFDAMKIDSMAVREVMYGEEWNAPPPSVAAARPASSSAHRLRRRAEAVAEDAATATDAKQPPRWEKTVTVGFAPGVLPSDYEVGGDEAVLRVARSVLDGVTKLAGMGTEQRRLSRRRRKTMMRRRRAGQIDEEREGIEVNGGGDRESVARKDELANFASLSESFSVTAADAASLSSRRQRQRRMTRRGAHEEGGTSRENATIFDKEDGYHLNDDESEADVSTTHERFWSKTFRRGLESSHMCSSMMSSIVLRPRPYGAGFLVVLDPLTPPTSAARFSDSPYHNGDGSHSSYTNRAPKEEKKRGATTAASSVSSSDNPYCVLSLLAGLAADRRVLSVSSGGRITGDGGAKRTPAPAMRKKTEGGPPSPKKGEAKDTTKEKREVNPDDRGAQWVTQGGDGRGDTPFHRAGLGGRNQVAGICDSGLDTKHCLFRDNEGDGAIYYVWDYSRRKVVKYDWIHDEGDHKDGNDGHGTHVAGTVAGKASGKDSDTLPSGVAPDARIAFFDMRKGDGGMYNPGADVLFDSVRGKDSGRGARVVNGSWGRTIRPYSDFCVDYDSGLYRNDDMVYVASTGNLGDDIKYWGDPSIKDPALCKNGIAVGASYGDDNYEDFVSYSSLGPTLDGRSKPDIVAPGIDVNSAIAGSECTFEEWEGTSMAAPVVTGSVVLIRQYFEEGWYPCGLKNCGAPIVPSGSLLKAVLMNGAQTLDGKVKRYGKTVNNADLKPYDNKQGMGRIHLLSSLSLFGENSINTMVVNDKEIGDGQVDDAVVQITCSHETISVTIAWYDPPSLQSCKECLINDLDLSITRQTDSAGKVVHDPKYFPNGRKDADTKNNVERIQIRGAKENEAYRIQVKGTNLAKPGMQKYSLVATGCFRVLEEGKEGHLSSQEDSNADNGGIFSPAFASAWPTNINLKNSRVKFYPDGKKDGTPKRCGWLEKEESRRRQFCSQEAGINNLVDAACPETCGKYDRNAPCHDTEISLGRTLDGEEKTCGWLQRNQKGWKKCGHSGEIRNKKADAICPMTCGWCG